MLQQIAYFDDRVRNRGVELVFHGNKSETFVGVIAEGLPTHLARDPSC